MSEEYKKVITILTSKLSAKDYKNIAVKIAQDYPEAFLDAYTSTKLLDENVLFDKEEKIFQAVVKSYRQNNNSTIYAIKTLRELDSSYGLKEAKEYVDEKVKPYIEKVS